MASFTASIGDLLAENNDKKTYNVFKKIKFLNNWMAIFTATCLLIITQDFIKCWLGTKYLLSNFVLFILVMNYYQNDYGWKSSEDKGNDENHILSMIRSMNIIEIGKSSTVLKMRKVQYRSDKGGRWSQ